MRQQVGLSRSAIFKLISGGARVCRLQRSDRANFLALHRSIPCSRRSDFCSSRICRAASSSPPPSLTRYRRDRGPRGRISLSIRAKAEIHRHNGPYTIIYTNTFRGFTGSPWLPLNVKGMQKASETNESEDELSHLWNGWDSPKTA